MQMSLRSWRLTRVAAIDTKKTTQDRKAYNGTGTHRTHTLNFSQTMIATKNVAIKMVFKQSETRLSPVSAAKVAAISRKNEVAMKKAIKHRDDMRQTKGGQKKKGEMQGA